MRTKVIAGLIFWLGIVSIPADSIDDKLKNFETAVKDAPPPKADSAHPQPTARLEPALAQLHAAVAEDGNDAQAVMILQQLLEFYPSEKVAQLGNDLMQMLCARQKKQAEVMEVRTDAVLAAAKNIITHAKTAADLDGLVADLRSLQPRNTNQFSPASSRVEQTFQFVTQWQNYLAALANGNRQAAQNELRGILNGSQQINSPAYFPRSEILAKMAELDEPGTNGHLKPGGINLGITPPPDYWAQADKILRSVKTVDDVSDALNKLDVLSPTRPGWDWSSLRILDKTRDDLQADLPASLDLRKAVYGTVYGDDVSRLEAMELRVILPYYLGTEKSNPPKAKETLDDYLDRLASKASAAGDLSMLQRVLTVQFALRQAASAAPPPNIPGSFPATPSFLAGLSEEAAGQYAAATQSYEKALQNPDDSLPLQIVGARMAALKSEHPDDFEKGEDAFLTPPQPSPFPPMPPNFQTNPPQTTTVLPIPLELSIPPQPRADSSKNSGPSGSSPANH